MSSSRRRVLLAAGGAIAAAAAAGLWLGASDSPGAPRPVEAAALLLGWAATMLAAHEAARLAWARGPERRRQLRQDFARRLADGQFDALASPAPAWRHDDQLLALRAELREVHEERARVQRLLTVLRASEPDRARRDAFDRLRLAVDGDDRFADAALAVTPPPAVAQRPSWPRIGACLLLAGAAWALAAGGGS